MYGFGRVELLHMPIQITGIQLEPVHFLGQDTKVGVDLLQAEVGLVVDRLGIEVTAVITVG